VNKTNKILIVSVSVLCIAGAILLFKAAFSGAEFGSVSDWVSSVCNIAMAGAAVYAAMNAKDWIQQRKDEDAYKLASEVMLNNLYDLANHVKEIGESNKILDGFSRILNHDFKTITDYDGFEKAFKPQLQWGKEVHNISKSISRLSGLGWELKEKPSDLLMKICESYNLFYEEHTRMWFDIRSNHFNTWTTNPNPIELKRRIEGIELYKNGFDTYYKEFDCMFDTFEKYFDKLGTKK
jgi:hypothetical protein